jgi:Ethanolamine utilization protein EutJ (predicted chaperonin)
VGTLKPDLEENLGISVAAARYQIPGGGGGGGTRARIWPWSRATVEATWMSPEPGGVKRLQSAGEEIDACGGRRRRADGVVCACAHGS